MRKLLDSFTATHVTCLVIAALFAPSALYGVTAFTNVALEDPANGHRATINTGGQVYTYNPVADPLAGYARDPKNFVSIQIFLSSSSCSASGYTVPTGKALILETMSAWMRPNSTSGQASTDLFLGATCDQYVDTLAHSAPHIQSVSQSFRPGFVVSSGNTLSANSAIASGNLHLYGYLVPASAAPTAAEARLTSAQASPSAGASVGRR